MIVEVAGSAAITGAVLSIFVLYVTELLLPQLFVTVTVITALQVPEVEAVLVNDCEQLFVAVVAVIAAASALETEE